MRKCSLEQKSHSTRIIPALHCRFASFTDQWLFVDRFHCCISMTRTRVNWLWVEVNCVPQLQKNEMFKETKDFYHYDTIVVVELDWNSTKLNISETDILYFVSEYFVFWFIFASRSWFRVSLWLLGNIIIIIIIMVIIVNSDTQFSHFTIWQFWSTMSLLTGDVRFAGF